MSELIFSQNIDDTLKSYCLKHQIHNIVVLTDENTHQFCLPLFNQNHFKIIKINAGENHKNIETLTQILNQMSEFELKRNDLLFNLGGGVVSDIGGFAASIYQRGIDYINIPTTLLSMVDASIGGKTGIDFKHYKNFLGSFKKPKAIMISSQFLKTLQPEDIKSAWAEILKMAFVYSKELFDMVQNQKDLNEIINTCSALKTEIVDKDFKDNGIRQLLNFGHTIGHAYESYRLSINQPVLHGFAVAKGMIYEIKLAEKYNKLNSKEAKNMIQMIQSIISVEELTLNELNALKQWIKKDKKNTNTHLVFSLPSSIGQGVYNIQLTENEVFEKF